MFSSSLPKTILRLTVVLALLVFGTWSFWKYQQAQQQLHELTVQPELTAEEQAALERQALILQVGQLTDLPEGENPLILNIENAAGLAAAQPFFRDVIDGDKVLIYAQSNRSIIYSPSRNIIVNEGTLTVVQGEQATESSEAAEE